MSRANITYQTFTSDGCDSTTHYCATDSGRNFRKYGETAWSPHEPDGETVCATVTFLLGHGRREEVELTGDQHRDLEDRELLTAWFTNVVDGEDPYDALELVLNGRKLAA